MVHGSKQVEAPSQRGSRRKRSRRCVVTAEIVPPGELTPNECNPSAEESAEDRWSVIVSVCARVIADASREERTPAARGQSSG